MRWVDVSLLRCGGVVEQNIQKRHTWGASRRLWPSLELHAASPDFGDRLATCMKTGALEDGRIRLTGRADPRGTALLPDPTPNLRSELADAVARSGADGQGVHVELLVRRGAPWEKLLNVAADLGADLIVVGSKGQRGAVHGFFLGSVAARLAATSPRCVLVVPASRARG